MKLPNEVHATRPWRIHEFVGDFRIEDVWALPTPGREGDFHKLVDLLASFDPEQHPSSAVRFLTAARFMLGRLFRWDEPSTGIGERVLSLKERLPEDLRATAVPGESKLPFSPLYQLDDEFAAEYANGTVHAVVHLGWVPDDTGRWRGELAIYVKPNGVIGEAYMLGIKPFRYTLVYPALMREVGRAWRAADVSVGAA